MESPIQLSIILPAYKEKENLEIFIPQIEEEFRNERIEIIVVDDHSMDGTVELIQSLNSRYGNVALIERPGLLGIGSAVRDGLNHARGEYLLSSDSDCSFRTADMRKLYETLRSGVDLVLGYRVDAPRERPLSGWLAVHGWIEEHVVSPLSNWVIGLISGIGLKNYNTNFRAMRADVWKRIKTVEDRQFFHFETIVRAKQAGAKISEIPVIFSPRIAGESKVSFLKQAPGYFLKLLRIVFFEPRA